MLTQNDIYAILQEALDITQKGATVVHPFSPSLQLLGREGVLDSLDAMIFLDNVDELLKAKTGKNIMLMGEDAFAREDTPFASIASLAAYIEELLGKR